MYPICIRGFLREWLLCADSYFLLASQRHNTMVRPHSYSPCHSRRIQGSWMQYFRALNCFFFFFFFFTHLWFCCLVKGSSCFAPLFNSLYIMYMSHYFHWVVTGYICSITFSADLHWPQISKGPVWSGLCWSSTFTSRVLGYKPFQVKA